MPTHYEKNELKNLLEKLDKNEKIILIGMRYSGKSTLAKLMAERHGLALVSLDKEFEVRFGPIEEFVKERGWKEFRTRESDLFRECLSGPLCLLETGGGLVETPRSRSLLSRRQNVVWVRTPLNIIVNRAHLVFLQGGSRNRPPYGRGNWEEEVQKIKETYQRRLLYYRGLADFILDTSTINA